jgi:3D (Asp-Asp-Asp) domain-containing protein
LYVPGFGLRVVNDCMNARKHNSIDLLVLTQREEKRIGTRHLTVYKVQIKEER